VKENTLQKVIASNISLAFHAKQYIIAFYPLHLSKFYKHDPIAFDQFVAHLRTLVLNHPNALYSIDFSLSLL
jgi:hypothetical protein